MTQCRSRGAQIHLVKAHEHGGCSAVFLELLLQFVVAFGHQGAKRVNGGGMCGGSRFYRKCSCMR